MTIGDSLFYGAAAAFWVVGIALSKGFWWILLACLFPPYAWVAAAKWALGVG